MVTIRKANVLDISGIIDCSKDSLPITYSYAELLFFILSKQYCTVVAIDGETVVGYILFKYRYEDDNRSHIFSFAVCKRYRNKGLGSKLISIAKQLCKAEYISLYVHTDNRLAIRCYEKNGFNKIKKLDNYYDGAIPDTNNQDAYLMVAKISTDQLYK